MGRSRKNRPVIRGVAAACLAAAIATVASCLAVAVAPAAGAQQAPTTSAPAPKASILVDVATGEVLAAHDARTPLPPASTTKLLTALAVVDAVPADAGIAVSERAAGMPARKVNMRAGDVWRRDDALAALLLSSANDAAVALGEAAGGSLEGFSGVLGDVAGRLGLADAPVVQDPSGLDDSWSVGGGNLLSARDLAIVGRAVLARPELATLVASPVVELVDPAGTPRRFTNHNKLLTRYPGTIGMKTGYTRRAGHTLVAAATRGERTLLAVVLRAPDAYGAATSLLDAGFAGSATPTGDVLPAVPAAPLTAGATAMAAGPPTAAGANDVAPVDRLAPVRLDAELASGSALDRFARSPAAAAVGGAGAVLWALRTRALRRRRRKAWRHHPLASATPYHQVRRVA